MSSENVTAAENEIRSALELANDEEATSITHAMIANALATLALVEQQRIANRIALGMYTNADGSRAGQFAVTRITGMSAVEVRPDIREALGLA